MDLQPLYDTACQHIESEAEELHRLSRSIWSVPELGYEERHAHGELSDFLEARGFRVERAYTGMKTAFRASWHNLHGMSPLEVASAPHVLVISEYDALPEIGHACGHNLIAEAGVAAGIGVKAAMEAFGKPHGKITVLGTPAEEGGGGKIKLIDQGALLGVDAALMVHPAPFDMPRPTVLAVQPFVVTYKGKTSHASVFPWKGLNALDAAVIAYNGVSALRQQLKPSTRVHAVILKGGVKANIIPDESELEVIARAVSLAELEVVLDKVYACFNGAAVITGCEVSIRKDTKPYLHLQHNNSLEASYRKHVTALQPDWTPIEDSTFAGSTDMGNVSVCVPSIHPFYRIGPHQNHTQEFTTLAGSPDSQGVTLTQGKAMALVALEVMADASLREAIKSDFAEARAAGVET